MVQIEINNTLIWETIKKTGTYSGEWIDKLIDYVISKYPNITEKRMTAITFLVYIIILYLILHFAGGLKKWIKILIVLLFLYLVAGLFI